MAGFGRNPWQVSSEYTNQKSISDLTVVIDRVSAVLLNAIEFHDPYTKGHGDRVSIIVQKLVQKMYPDLFPDKWELKLAAQLHDIGELGVNEMVLNKPTFLFLIEAERYMLRAHPQLGAKLLEHLMLTSDNILYMGILYHHENFDGSGYPKGLKGHDIPLIARLIKLADYYEALTHRRAYREAYSAKDALIIMEREYRCFDPDILGYFLDHYTEIIF